MNAVRTGMVKIVIRHVIPRRCVEARVDVVPTAKAVRVSQDTLASTVSHATSTISARLAPSSAIPSLIAQTAMVIATMKESVSVMRISRVPNAIRVPRDLEGLIV